MSRYAPRRSTPRAGQAVCPYSGKVRWRTWSDASDVARGFRRQRGIIVEPYHCVACGGWHTGGPSQQAHERHGRAPYVRVRGRAWDADAGVDGEG